MVYHDLSSERSKKGIIQFPRQLGRQDLLFYCVDRNLPGESDFRFYARLYSSILHSPITR